MARQPHLENCQPDDDQRKEPGQRCAIAHVEIVKSLLPNVQTEEPGGKAWPALGGDKGSGERLQRPNNAQHGIEEDRRREQRDRDMLRALPTIGPVDGRRVIQFLRHALQASEKDNHLRAANAAPQAHDDQRGDRPLAVGEPAGRMLHAQIAQPLIDQAKITVEQPLP